MANITTITAALDDGTTIQLFPVSAPVAGPTEAQVQGAVDTAVEGAFTPPATE